MIRGPDDPQAAEQQRMYVIELLDPENNLREFHKETTWREARAMVNELRERFGVTAIRLGVQEGDAVRELMTTGSMSTGAPEGGLTCTGTSGKSSHEKLSHRRGSS